MHNHAKWDDILENRTYRDTVIAQNPAICGIIGKPSVLCMCKELRERKRERERERGRERERREG